MNTHLLGKTISKILLMTFLVIWNSQRSDAQCPVGQVPVDIQITADANAAADNTRWELINPDGFIYASGTASQVVCVPTSSCLLFKIYDDFGNGLEGTPPGAYSLYYNGSLVDSGINFGTDKTVDIGNCASGSSCNFPNIINSTGSYTAPAPETWYSFVPTTTGRYNISTCNQGNNCNTTIWGYDYCDGVITEQSQQEAVFFSDDACGTLAELETYLIAGVTYYLRIGDSGTSCAGTSINWSLTYLGPVSGCTDLASCNYDPLATIDDGSCIYPGDPACPDGPDLIVLEDVISSSLQVQNYTNNNQCYINEGCLKGYGVRQILRFTTHIQNIGNTDYFIGSTPTSINDQSDQWEWDECHNHWHYEGYAEYLIFDDAGNRLPVGFKNGFCVIDLECSGGGSASYSCSNQGISHGCGDIYGSGLACQWVDLTNVPNGDYSLVVRVNWDKTPDALGRDEISYDNNWAQICFNLSRDNNGDAIVNELNNCTPVTDCLGELQGDAVIDCEGNCNGGRLAGDLDANDLYDVNDVTAYFQGILDDNIPLTTCNDISSDGVINMLEPAMLMSCILQQNYGGSQGASPSCTFPYLTVDNPGVSATFSIRNTNTTDQYFDIYLENQAASILAFNLNLTGVTISSLQSLIPDPNFSMNLGFDTSGEIAGLSYINTATPRYTSAEPFIRVYYSAIANEACISDVISVVNDKLELIPGIVSTANCTSANPPPSYCATGGQNAAYEWINRVALSNIDNTSGDNGGYADFTGQVANLTPGSYTINLEPGFGGTVYVEHWKVWIDFNVDGDFDDAGEELFYEVSNANVSGNITIPSGTGTINTRMRIAMRWNNDPASCGSFDYGEVEDYGIAISEVQNQTITFPILADKSTNDPPFNLGATASSGLPVTYTLVSGPAILSGEVVTLTGNVGTVTIRASQAGNSNFNPAPNITRSFNVNDAPLQSQTITFDPIADKETTDPPFVLNASASSGLPVSFSVVSGPATVSGDVVTLTGAEGIVTIRASQSGNANYNPAPVVEQSFNVSTPGLQSQTITFDPIADKATTDLPFTISATASSGLPVAFVVVSGPATLSGNLVTLTGNTGTVIIRASQSGNGTYAAAPNVNQSFNVSAPNPPGNYCTSIGTQPWVEWIDRVTFGTIDNESFKEQYADFTNLSTDIALSNSYPIDLNPGLSWFGHVTDLYWRVWIDFNQDGDFTDAGELVLEANNGKDPVSASITTPANALPGSTRMRIAMKKDSYASPCETFSYGEVEDYTVNVVSGSGGPVCDNITDGGVINGDQSSCDTYDPDLISSPVLPSGGSGLIQYQWELSTSSATGPWTNAGGSGITFDPGVINQTTWYRRLSRRENCVPYTGISNVITKTVDNCSNPGTYCDAIGTQPWWEWISEVIFGDIQSNTFKDAYGDYTNLSTDIEQGELYPITMNPGLSWSGHQTNLFWRVWIDFNQDGDFTDVGELVVEANNGRDPITEAILVPMDASLGTTRMRIAMQKDQYPGPCETFSYGEVEDYSVNIVPAAAPIRIQPLLDLDISRRAQTTLLEWVSNTEITNAYFIVERAVDHQEFEELMRVNSRQDTEGHFYYNRQDEDLVKGVLTYRIKQVHHDGSFVYSAEHSLDYNDLSEDLLLFPNPAYNEFWVKLNRYEGTSGTILIQNVYGQIIEERPVDQWTSKGEKFDLEAYRNGVYFVTLKLKNYKLLTAQLIVNRLE